jgi:hypothetical protein
MCGPYQLENAWLKLGLKEKMDKFDSIKSLYIHDSKEWKRIEWENHFFGVFVVLVFQIIKT